MPAIAVALYVLMQPAAWHPAVIAVKYSYKQGLPAHGIILALFIAAGGYLLLCVPAIGDLLGSSLRAGEAESAVVVWFVRGGLLLLLYLTAFGALSRFG